MKYLTIVSYRDYHIAYSLNDFTKSYFAQFTPMIRRLTSMRNASLILLTLLTSALSAQNKHTTFYDTAGNVTTWESHWAQVVTGRYKSVYNKSENKKTLVRTTREECAKELHKTEKRITNGKKIGTELPAFDVADVNGNRLTKADFKGKVLVVNFWFIGCAPCEMERPALNTLATAYSDNANVAFISFAKNDQAELKKFLAEHPFHYNVVPTDKDYIRTGFEISEYPANIVIDRNGKYHFFGTGTGIGIFTILKRQIDEALTDDKTKSRQGPAIGNGR